MSLSCIPPRSSPEYRGTAASTLLLILGPTAKVASDAVVGQAGRLHQLPLVDDPCRLFLHGRHLYYSGIEYHLELGPYVAIAQRRSSRIPPGRVFICLTKRVCVHQAPS